MIWELSVCVVCAVCALWGFFWQILEFVLVYSLEFSYSKLEWNFENFIKMRWMSFWFFCERVVCLNLLDFVLGFDKNVKILPEIFQGNSCVILWYVFKGRYDGVLTSFNQWFCECNTHELNILILEFIETSPCSIMLSMISYSIGDC